MGLQAHADRYTYLPQIGLSIMATWLAADWCAALRYRRAVLSTAAAVLLAVLAIAAHRQTRYWRDTFSLWTHTLACTDGNYLVLNTLGCLLAEKGQFEKAIPYFEKALEVSPNFDVTYFNLGVTFCLQRQFDKAIPYFEKALKINPNNAVMHCTLGTVLAKREQFDKAILHFKKALEINPNYVEAQNNLTQILAAHPDASP